MAFTSLLRLGILGIVVLPFGYLLQSNSVPALRQWWSLYLWASESLGHVPYEVQVFKADPLILYIRNFLSETEISHIIKNT